MHVAWAAWIGGRKHNSTPNGGHALHEAISFNCVSQFLINLRSELSLMHAKVEETLSFHPAVDVYLAVCNNLSDLIVSLSQRGQPFVLLSGDALGNYPGVPLGYPLGDVMGTRLGCPWAGVGSVVQEKIHSSLASGGFLAYMYLGFTWIGIYLFL